MVQHARVHVERLAPDDWRTLREVRLRALLTDPDSFGSTWQDEHDGDETWWRDWLAEHVWLAARDDDGTVLGIVAAVPPPSAAAVVTTSAPAEPPPDTASGPPPDTASEPPPDTAHEPPRDAAVGPPRGAAATPGAGAVSPQTLRSAPGQPFMLNGFWVDPTARGRGAARALVLAVQDLALRSGAESLLLTVVDGNIPARRLFSALGFTTTGDRTPRERDPSRWNDRMLLHLPGPDGETPRGGS